MAAAIAIWWLIKLLVSWNGHLRQKKITFAFFCQLSLFLSQNLRRSFPQCGGTILAAKLADTRSKFKKNSIEWFSIYRMVTPQPFLVKAWVSIDWGAWPFDLIGFKGNDPKHIHYKMEPPNVISICHVAVVAKTRETAISFQIEEIHREHACWRLGSLPGSTGNLGLSGWDIDNRVVDVVRHHSIERLPQKKGSGHSIFKRGTPFSQPRHKFHPNQPFYIGQMAKYCKNRRNCNFHFK